jgi:hypothetical protein
MSCRKRSLLIALALAAPALFTGCNGMEVSGSLHSDKGTLGTWDFSPTSCLNGQSREFVGADFGDGAKNVRLVQDPVSGGWFVTISLSGDPGRPDAILSPSMCQTLSANLHQDDTGNQQEASVEGSLVLACTTPGGGSLTGRLDFSGCENPGE